MSTRLASGRLARACAALAALASTTPLWAADGFIEGTKANLNLRNFYFNRNFVDPAYTAQNKAEEWTQSFIFGLTSGYTQGPV
ncbi:OprD family outer membrane porin, partial [Pseudomonas oryzihabitans]|uniref:OprD family outer membrane porin n=2 Tax=Pseudomonas TaxID=286 RepID=UPI00119F1378